MAPFPLESPTAGLHGTVVTPALEDLIVSLRLTMAGDPSFLSTMLPWPQSSMNFFTLRAAHSHPTPFLSHLVAAIAPLEMSLAIRCGLPAAPNGQA